MKTRYGTAHFVSRDAANSYYGREDAAYKLAAGEIFIGKPELKNNEVLLIDKDDGRYMIEVNNREDGK